jgi:two-component system OmpR family sensor kinase
MEPLDLAVLARRSVGGITVSSPDRRVVVDAPDRVMIDGDGRRMRQVVDNLLVNADTHTPPGAAVTVTVAHEDGWGLLTVHDEGPGIDPSDASRIFEPFYRADPSRSRSSGGAGLGLAIVAAIVEAHRGTVRALPGSGATFEVRVPEHRTGTSDGPGGEENSAHRG